MCGIVCGIGDSDVIAAVLSGLKRLEYRGYDSAGVSFLANQQVLTKKVVGKVDKLANLVATDSSNIAIAHTRWATHGEANYENAHPHVYDNSAWVHNGIINNHSAMRKLLIKNGYELSSDTDSEVLGFLFNFIGKEQPMLTMQECFSMLTGSFAWVMLQENAPDRLIFASKDSPLVLGVAKFGRFLASDPLALIDVCDQFYCIPANSIGWCSSETEVVLSATTLDAVEIVPQDLSIQINKHSDNRHKHFMHAEIFEQPEAVARVLDRFCHAKGPSEEFKQILSAIPEQIKILQCVGCGSSYYAALLGQYWFNEWSELLVQCDIASEFRLQKFKNIAPAMLLALSQSGETADTLLAFAKNGYQVKASLCNVAHSSLSRNSDIMIPILAKQEIGVASTKAFTNQIMLLMLLACQARPEFCQEMLKIPFLIRETLKLEPKIKAIADSMCHEQQVLFLGRGIMYPVALEGALKLKELSYIHAHAYPAGELKHGPLALIDDQLLVIGLLNNDTNRAKSIANLREVQARKGRLVIFFDGNVGDLEHLQAEHILELPTLSAMSSPFAFTVALQLLAYHIANNLGKDVDQPRNLAKSVTVE